MGQGLKHQLIGMHFFNPVPAMKLVEIINAYDTSEDTIETGKAVAKALARSSSPCRTCPCSSPTGLCAP